MSTCGWLQTSQKGLVGFQKYCFLPHLCKVFMFLAHRKNERHSTIFREFMLTFAEGMLLTQNQTNTDLFWQRPPRELKITLQMNCFQNYSLLDLLVVKEYQVLGLSCQSIFAEFYLKKHLFCSKCMNITSCESHVMYV